MESCPVVPQLTEFALAEIAALAPAEKQGRKTVLNLDPDLFDVYVEQLDDVELARKVLKRFDESVRDAIRTCPRAGAHGLGYELRPRAPRPLAPEALRAAHEVLGDDFYELIGLTKTAVERLGGRRRRGRTPRHQHGAEGLRWLTENSPRRPLVMMMHARR
jgi:hypothetical protein